MNDTKKTPEADSDEKHNGDNHHLYKRGKRWWIQWAHDGKQFKQTTKTKSVVEARAVRDEVLKPYVLKDKEMVLQTVIHKLEQSERLVADAESEKNPPLTLALGFEAYEASPEKPDAGKLTLKSYRVHWNLFEKWVKEHQPKIRYMNEVSQEIAAGYFAWLSPKVSANTYNKRRGFLRLAYTVLSGRARVGVNPFDRIKKKAVVQNKRRELTIEELTLVCSKASGDLRLLFCLGIYTGLRLNDCVNLQWHEVDFVRRIIARIPSKTKRRNREPVKIPIHPVLARMLLEIPARSHKGCVFPRFAKLYARDVSAVSDLVQKHFLACGIDTLEEGTGITYKCDDKGRKLRDGKKQYIRQGSRGVVRVSFHSLRHTFVSLCANAGTSLTVVQAMVGHESPAMTEHYAHIGMDATQKAIRALPYIGEGAEGYETEGGEALRLGGVLEQVEALLGTMTVANWSAVRTDIQARIHEYKENSYKSS